MSQYYEFDVISKKNNLNKLGHLEKLTEAIDHFNNEYGAELALIDLKRLKQSPIYPIPNKDEAPPIDFPNLDIKWKIDIRK